MITGPRMACKGPTPLCAVLGHVPGRRKEMTDNLQEMMSSAAVKKLRKASSDSEQKFEKQLKQGD